MMFGDEGHPTVVASTGNCGLRVVRSDAQGSPLFVRQRETGGMHGNPS